MKTAFALLFALSFTSAAFAASSPSAISKEGHAAAAQAAVEMKKGDVRSIVREVENVDGNPCMPEGWSLQVILQVKQASYNRITKKTEYDWQTVKTVGVDNDGLVMEVCGE